MGQPPLTFTRQLLAACCDPSLIKSKAYPPDVLDRASTVLQSVHGQSIGKYERTCMCVYSTNNLWIMWLNVHF